MFKKPRVFKVYQKEIIQLIDGSPVYRIIPRMDTSISTPQIPSTSVNNHSETLPPDTTSNSVACVPSRKSFKGTYGFDIYFEPVVAEMKKAGWIYSKSRDKLYVAKDLPCPIHFTTETAPPSNAKIRVTVVFAQPIYAKEVVRRCINHSFIDLNNGVINPDHLIRCDSDQTVYETDDTTERRSLILPYEYSKDGTQQYAMYIFKFMCFGSCAGGLNRRPIKVIFTLEINNQVVGRRSLDVKICACPWRDANREDDKLGISPTELTLSSSSDDSSSRKRKRKDNESPFTDVIEFVKEMSNGSLTGKPPASPPNENGSYTIMVNDYEEYAFLKQVKKLYEITKVMQSIPPELVKYLKSIQKRKKDLDS